MRPLLANATACMISILVINESSLGAPPDIKGLFPLGAAVGSTTEVTLTGATGLKGTQVWSSEPGLTFEIPETGTNFKVSVAPEAEPGLRWLRFFNAEGASALTPFVVGTLAEASEVEPNNLPEKAQKIAASTVINGKLAEAGDVDCFGISVVAGQTIVAAVDAHWRLGQPVDAVIQVLSPDGVVVDQNDDDQGNDPLLAVTADRAGIWYVRVFGFPVTPDSSIRFAGGATFKYRLTLTTGAFANHAVPSVIGRDADRKLRVVGWNVTENEALNVVTKPTLSGLPLPKFANNVAVEDFDGLVVVEQEPNDLEHPQQLTVGAVACGVIDQPRDEDVFVFSATKGAKLEFDVESRSLGFPLDAVLRIRSADKAVIVESDDGPGKDADPFLKWTAPSDGEFSVSIRDVFKNGGWRHAYRLWLRRAEPKVVLTTKSDVFAISPDKTVEVPVTVTRTDGFTDEVAVSISGLPDGATCEPVVSAGKGDTAGAVKLIVKANADVVPWSGPIQILGKPAGAAEKRLVATFAIPTSRSTTDVVWLTVLAPAEKK